MNTGMFRITLCFITGLLLVFYAVPRLPIEHLSTLATGFSIIWLSFALVVIGANLHALLLFAEKRRGLNQHAYRIYEQQLKHVHPAVMPLRKYTRRQLARHYNRLL